MSRRDVAVALCIRGLGRGGAERLLFQEAVDLDRAGFRVEVWYQVPGEFVAELQTLGIPTVLLRPQDARRHLRRLRGSQGRLVVHTHAPLVAGLLRLAAARMRRTTFIHTEHNVVNSYRRGTALLHRATSRRVDVLVAVSHAVLASAPRARTSRVLYHLSTDSPRMLECLSARYKAAGDLRILCVASLTPKKDHDNLFRALAEVSRLLPRPIAVDVVGDGPRRREVEMGAERASRLPNITVSVLGVQDDVPALLRQSDVLVLPSRSEGLALVLMEALASSTPVVATSVGGVPELVEHGHTGLLVPPADPVSLGRALVRVLGDGDFRRSLAVAGKQAAETMAVPSWTRFYVDLIDELTAGDISSPTARRQVVEQPEIPD